VLIAVTGGTGFVGRHVVNALRQRGHRTRVLVRDPDRTPFQPSDAIEAVSGSLANPAALRDLTRSADAVIHLVGIIVERGPHTFESVHVDGTRAVLAAAAEAGCRRFIHMSALGARDEAGATPYHRTKRRGELLVLGSGLTAAVFRPSLVNGPGNVPIRTLARLHRLLPAVPIFGDGSYPTQPVWVDDLALAFALAAERDASGLFELGGPAVVTYLEFVRAIGRATGHPRPLLGVPLPLVRAAAAAFDLLGHLAPLTSDQLQMLVEGSVTPQNALEGVFGITPLGFEEGLRRFLRPTHRFPKKPNPGT